MRRVFLPLALIALGAACHLALAPDRRVDAAAARAAATDVVTGRVVGVYRSPTSGRRVVELEVASVERGTDARRGDVLRLRTLGRPGRRTADDGGEWAEVPTEGAAVRAYVVRHEASPGVTAFAAAPPAGFEILERLEWGGTR